MNSEIALQGLYPQNMGESWQRLAPAVRGLHCDNGEGFRARGTLVVTRGRGPLVWLLAVAMRLPPASKGTETVLTVTREGGQERWVRDFAAVRVVTVQHFEGGVLEERFGPVVLRFRLSVTESGGLRYDQIGAGLRLGAWVVPWPLWMAPRVSGVEAPGAAPGRTALDIEIGGPVVGRLVRYEGWMTREAP